MANEYYEVGARIAGLTEPEVASMAETNAIEAYVRRLYGAASKWGGDSEENPVHWWEKTNEMRDAFRVELERLRDLAYSAHEPANRWDGFSIEELQEIANGASMREDSLALPNDQRARAKRIMDEAKSEFKRRRGGYRGPGIYEHAPDGEDPSRYEVLGTNNLHGAYVVIRDPARRDHILLEKMTDFNYVDGRGPRYRRVGDLPEASQP